MYPIFASPMESVIDENNYKIFIENKITPVIPRSIMQRCSIEDRLKLSEETFVSFSEKEVYGIFEKGMFDLSGYADMFAKAKECNYEDSK